MLRIIIQFIMDWNVKRKIITAYKKKNKVCIVHQVIPLMLYVPLCVSMSLFEPVSPGGASCTQAGKTLGEY